MSGSTSNLPEPSSPNRILLIGCVAFVVGLFFCWMLLFGWMLHTELRRSPPAVVVSADSEQAWWMLPQKDVEYFIAEEIIDARKVTIRWHEKEWKYSAEINNRDKLRDLGNAFLLKDHLQNIALPSYAGPDYYVEVEGSKLIHLHVYGTPPRVAFGPTQGKKHPDQNDERWWSWGSVSPEFLIEIESLIGVRPQ